VTDRDGMCVHVTAEGAMSFRMDYRLNGRRETIYLGKYGFVASPGTREVHRRNPTGDDLTRDVRFGASTLMD
jgi:hypothetical protein